VRSADESPRVILVHGLWFGAWALRPLAHRLRHAGFAPHCFHYRTTRGGIQDHARALREYIESFAGPRPHFVAHSLGGLVTLHMLEEAMGVVGRRVVLLGSPLGGSVAARKSARLPGGTRLLGGAAEALERGVKALPAGYDIGVIAGSQPVGLGLLLGGTAGPGDGTVAISETVAEGLKEHRILPVTHTGMLYSKDVAREVVCFLRTGNFTAPP